MCNVHDLPGLYLFEEFISKEEEQEIIHHLDGTKHRANDFGHENQMCQQSNNNDHDADGDYYLPWKPSRFNGKHLGKRWGVHCSLKDRKVYPVDNPLPACIQAIMDRIETGPETKINNVHSQIRQIMKECKLNEANAIDYRRAKGDFLKNHVDDRQLSKEPIANLSLAGDCYMTFRRESGRKLPSVADETKVLLKRRTLQILTGSARYTYSHGIRNEDLLTDRRISITMRESPLSK
jgi:alkylated DNA repair dioxygenase AlkB